MTSNNKFNFQVRENGLLVLLNGNAKNSASKKIHHNAASEIISVCQYSSFFEIRAIQKKDYFIPPVNSHSEYIVF